MDDKLCHDLNWPDSDDDETMVEFGRQLALDGLLREVFGDSVPATQESKATRAPESDLRRAEAIGRRSRKRWFVACLTVAASLFAALIAWKMNSPAELAEWQVYPSANAQFRTIEPNVIELTSGELMLESGDGRAARFTVITPNSRVVSDGAKCVIGSHQLKPADEQGASTMIRQLTRVLVIAGMATLSNDDGHVEARAEELAHVIDKASPVWMTVKYNTQFGIDVFQKIAKENGGENVFISPFSISSTLAMLAEGARGQTALELGRVLRFPEVARRTGSDAELIPWETAKIYAGISSLNQILNRANQTRQQTLLRKQVDEHRQELQELRGHIKQTADRPPEEYRQLEAKEKTLSRENRKLAVSRKKLAKGSDEYKRLTSQIDEIRREHAELRKQKDQLRDRLMREIYEPLARKEQALVDQINTSLKSVGGYELRIANAIWAEQSRPFEEAYVKAVSEAFQTGGLIPADFRNQPQEELKRINRWIEEQTNHRIQGLLPDDAVDSSTGMVLTNAIYFLGDWKFPFKTRYTRPRDFTLSDGTQIKTPTMRQSIDACLYSAANGDGSIFVAPDEYDANNKPQLYPDDEGFHMVSLPYRGDDISMVILAPMKHDGLPRLEASLTDQRLTKWIASLKPRTTSLMLPKFKLEQSYQLVEVLRGLGLQSPFVLPSKPGGADFTGITNPPSESERLFVSHVVHETFVEVNEQGTEAAAATAAAAKDEEQEIVKFIPYFHADRPFLFLIRDDKTGAILFMGRLVMPAVAS